MIDRDDLPQDASDRPWWVADAPLWLIWVFAFLIAWRLGQTEFTKAWMDAIFLWMLVSVRWYQKERS